MKTCLNCQKRPTCNTPCNELEKELKKVTRGRLSDGSIDTEIPFSRFTDYEVNTLLENAENPFTGTKWNYDYWKVVTKDLSERDANIVFDYYVLGMSELEIISKYSIKRSYLYKIVGNFVEL